MNPDHKKDSSKNQNKLVTYLEQNAITNPDISQIVENNKKLLSIIAHDIKSPFGSMISFLNLLKDRIYFMNNDEIKKHVEYVLLSANQTHSLLDSLLEWASAFYKVKRFNPELARLSDILNQEIKHTQMIISQKNITINAEDVFNEWIILDKNMIRSVFRNLLYNAAKYSYNDGEIIVNSIRKDSFIEISIKDNGIGISLEHKKKLFTNEGFISTLGTNDEPGTGYGLLLCKEFINAHGGKIWVVIDNEKGSEFKFTLPINKNG